MSGNKDSLLEQYTARYHFAKQSRRRQKLIRFYNDPSISHSYKQGVALRALTSYSATKSGTEDIIGDWGYANITNPLDFSTLAQTCAFTLDTAAATLHNPQLDTHKVLSILKHGDYASSSSVEKAAKNYLIEHMSDEVLTDDLLMDLLFFVSTCKTPPIDVDLLCYRACLRFGLDLELSNDWIIRAVLGNEERFKVTDHRPLPVNPTSVNNNMPRVITWLHNWEQIKAFVKRLLT